MFKQLGGVLICILLLSANVYAQGTSGQASVTETKDGFVSLDFRDADINNVLQILSLKSGVNIVTSPEVQGLVTIKLTDVPWQQALDVVLQTYGYAYEKKGKVIMVTTIENLKQRREDAMLLAEQEPLVTETFNINFGIASEIIESLDKMKSERGSVNFDARTNMIIVNDIPSKIDLMSGVITKLDATTPQVLIEAKIVETQLNDTEELGIDWTVQATARGAARPTSYPFTTSTENKYADDDFPAAAGGLFTFGTVDFSQMQSVLEMLKSRTDTNILSNPRIVTLDNKEAVIEVGTQNPIPAYGANPETGALQVIDLDWINIGINFSVTPHVNNAGYVTLDVEPEVSSTNGAVVFENISVPLISTERAKTSVMVADGDTLVIAGLIKDTTTDTKKKTPILGDIPILGLAFQKKDKTIAKTDLIIFITPHIVTPDLDS